MEGGGGRREGEGFWERLHGGRGGGGWLLIGSFVYNFILFIAVFFCRAKWDTMASRRKTGTDSRGGSHHEEGAPTLLFLMVASEHSASDESQSESPNCSGF